jgi:hypothetical protein
LVPLTISHFGFNKYNWLRQCWIIYDGKNNPFSQKLFEMCGDTYYDAFIEGCMSVDNSREVCEQDTDAE